MPLFLCHPQHKHKQQREREREKGKREGEEGERGMVQVHTRRAKMKNNNKISHTSGRVVIIMHNWSHSWNLFRCTKSISGRLVVVETAVAVVVVVLHSFTHCCTPGASSKLSNTNKIGCSLSSASSSILYSLFKWSTMLPIESKHTKQLLFVCVWCVCVCAIGRPYVRPKTVPTRSAIRNEHEVELLWCVCSLKKHQV